MKTRVSLKFFVNDRRRGFYVENSSYIYILLIGNIEWKAK